jgi:MoaA/NifB/PqqE/SkfB family radical SAM enzyme
MLTDEQIRHYNSSRQHTDKSVLCHAPFINLNFEQNGNMTACCYNRQHVLGTYPKDSILSAWNGIKANELRTYINHKNLDGGCKLCQELIGSKNYLGSRAIAYDHFVLENSYQKVGEQFELTNGNYPQILEFEVANTCNLACNMCNGYFSSTIRKKREKLDPLKTPYGTDFISQIKEILPFIKAAKFLGGEPFLIKLYYDIWKLIEKINPNIQVNVTTNGTINNGRVKDVLLNLNSTLCISLDSINKAVYENIRIGANFERVIENFEEFYEILHRKNSAMSIAVCPMKSNWQELPDLVNFANSKEISIWFNTVWYPESISLRSLPTASLIQVINQLSQQHFDTFSEKQVANVRKYQSVIKTLIGWIELK